MTDVVEYIIKLKDEMGGTLNTVQANTEHLNSTMGGLNSTIKNIGYSLLAYFGTQQIISFGQESLKAFTDLKVANAGLALALQNTGGVSRETMQSLKALNEQVFTHSTYSQADIAESEKTLLAYKNIGNEIYNRALPAITDFAAFTHRDLSESVRLIGRALNDPINGVQRLTLAFPGLTKEMLEHIKVTRETIGLLAAQKELLGDVTATTKGFAESVLKNDPWGYIGKQIMLLKESFGELIAEILNKVMPTLLKIVQWAKDSVTWMKENKKVLKDVGEIMLIMAGIIGVVITATKIWTAAQWLLNLSLEANPIGVVVTAIGALVTAIVIAYNHCKSFRDFIDNWSPALLKWGKVIIDGLVFPFVMLYHSIAAVYDVLTGDWSGALANINAVGQTALDNLNDVADAVGTTVNAATGANTVASSSPAAKASKASSDLGGGSGSGGGSDVLGSGLGTGTTSEKEKPTTINININGGIGNNMRFEGINEENTAKTIRHHVLLALDSAVRDSQIVAGQ